MANYSHNQLIISKTDNKKSEAEFEQFQKDNIIYEEDNLTGKLTFEGLIPMPKELNITSPQNEEADIKQAEINLKKYGFKDWYDWRNKYWGTKWNPQTSRIEKTDDKIIIFYDTAWAPGEGWLNKIAETYLNLEFEFKCSEESGEFEGDGIVKNGIWDWKINRPAKWVEKMEKEEENKK
tara:strand:+ start:212 stop:748 length:537 start_codon:yes stop_codon:yes gene_type:complete